MMRDQSPVVDAGLVEPENLHHALRQLRRMDAPVTIWVDQLCVN